MDLFDMFSAFNPSFFNNQEKKRKEKEERLKNFYKSKQDLYDHLRMKPRYDPTFGTYYGDRIYGRNLKEWIQTKPAPSGKQFHLNKANWKPIFITTDNIIVEELV